MLNLLKTHYLILVFIILVFLLRIINFSFPDFTTDEARIAYRGYTLATDGIDELGRSYPLIFNSKTDYQLPVTSYITAIGIKVFGKSDIGARIPFVLIGCGVTILIFFISKVFSKDKKYWFTSLFIVATSYPLIFLSKTPNDSIVLVFLITALFYLLIKMNNSKIHTFLIVVTLIVSMFTSKFSWFILTPFVALTLYIFQKESKLRKKIQLISFTFLLSVVAIFVFTNIPQGKRSLLENNFSIVSDISIQNGVNRLRGQGVESGWPNLFEKIVLNKTHFFTTGVLHWISQLGPRFYFGQFDENGQFNFSQLGAYSKILIIPFISGFIYLLKRKDKKEILVFLYPLVLTYPAIFTYPEVSFSLLVLSIPFLALIISFGFMNFKKRIEIVIFLVLILDLIMNLSYLVSEKVNTKNLRPGWVKDLTLDLYAKSITVDRVAISDDIVSDIANFIQWNNLSITKNDYLDLLYPYRFTKTNVNNIKIIGSSNEFYLCGDNRYEFIIASKRDKQKAQVLNIQVDKVYKNNVLDEVGYVLEKPVCIK